MLDAHAHSVLSEDDVLLAQFCVGLVLDLLDREPYLVADPGTASEDDEDNYERQECAGERRSVCCWR